MALSDRLRSAVGAAGRALTGYSAASPPVPAFAPGSPDRADRDPKRVQELRSREALFGRTTYAAGPSMTRYGSNPATGVEPQQIWSYQQLRNNGYPQLWAEFCEQTIERDGHLGGIYDTRRQAVSDKPFRLHPARRGSTSADFLKALCERVVERIHCFDQAVEDLLSATAYGYALSEIVWTEGRVHIPVSDARSVTVDLVLPQSIEWVHWKHLRFDRYTDEPYLWLASGDYTIPPHKFIFHDASGTGFSERRGFMSSCAWLSSAKRWSERDWLVYAKLFGIPNIKASYPDGIEEYATHRDQYEQFLKNYGEGIPFLAPDDLKVEISREPGGRSNDIFGALIGWANAEMSKRILGSTLTVEIGNQGAYAAADTHRDAPYMRSRADARKLASSIRSQLFRAIIEENAHEIARAIGVPPDSLADESPTCSWRIEREMSPVDRQKVYEGAVNELGVEVDEEQYRDEFGMDAPRSGAKALRGKPIAIGSGGLAPSLEASQDGAEATKEEGAGGVAVAGSDASAINLTPTDVASIVRVKEARASQGLPPFGDERDEMTVTEYQAKNAATVATAAAAASGKPEPDDPNDPPQGGPGGGKKHESFSAASDAIGMGWNEGDHPRKKGQFAPKGSGDGGAASDEGGKEKASSGKSDSTGATPSSKPKKPKQGESLDDFIRARVAEHVEKHFGPAKGDEAKKDAPAAKPPKPFKLKVQRAPRPKKERDPNAPAPAPREYHRDHRGRFCVKPQPGDTAAQLTLPTKLPTAKKAGKTKVDPSKVPGGGQSWKVRTNSNPEAGYKGRSFVMHSVKDGIAEFLATPCGRPDIDGYQGDKPGGWTNGDVLQAVMGKNYGDATVWKEIGSATDAKVTDLESAFKALATPRKTGRGVRDWRDFNLESIQAAHPAFAVLSKPQWLDEHANDQQTAEYYRQQAETHAEKSANSSNKQLDSDDLPYYGGEEEYHSYNHKGDLSDVPF